MKPTWDEIIESAKRAGAKFPEVVAAVWAKDSHEGEISAAKYNYFGFHGNKEEGWNRSEDGFIIFDTLDDGIAYLVDRWFKDWHDCRGVDFATTRNECATRLVLEGYSHDPDYAIGLIQMMDNKLSTPGDYLCAAPPPPPEPSK